MFGVHIDLQPVIQQAVRELKAATDSETESLMNDLAESAPDELQNMLGYGDRSKEGEPPTNDSFELFRSIRAQAEGSSVLLEFAEHAFYLDPFFKGQGKGGGYLNRPFIEQGIENAVGKLKSI